MKANWRESASIIIAAKNTLKHSQLFDYNLLFLKRKNTANFANALVFPGGVIEPSDADLKWQNLFNTQGYFENNFKLLFPNTKMENRPRIFCGKSNELPREISLRISAIRETFEECGILLCNKPTDSKGISKIAQHFTITNDELKFWQNKVHKNADEFYNMCEKFECHPNLWALHEWGNWLTPTFFPASMRFDTAFFFASLPHTPDSNLCFTEMEELMWMTPDEVMASYKNSLLPPQRYEILKMAKHSKLDSLLEHALERSRKGAQLRFPIRIILSDGFVHVLPGDSMYPDKVDLYNKQVIDMSNMTIKQLREISPIKKRTEIFNDTNTKEASSILFHN